MNGIGKYILIGLGVALLHWTWVICGPLFFLTDAEALILKNAASFCPLKW